MNKFGTLFLEIFKARKPAGGKKEPKYGKGKHKQAILVHTPSGKVVTQQRTVGVTEKRPQPAGLRRHQEWKKQEKQNNAIASNLSKHLEGVDMGEFENPKLEYPKAPKPEKPKRGSKKKDQQASLPMTPPPTPAPVAEKPKRGGKSKKAEPVKPIANVGKQGLKSSKVRQEAEARQGMFDEESDLARAMVGEGKATQSIAEREKEILAEKPKKEKKKPNTGGLQKFNANKKDSKQLADARQGMFDEEGDLARAMVGEGKAKEPPKSGNSLSEQILMDKKKDPKWHSSTRMENLESVFSNAGIRYAHSPGKGGERASLEFVGAKGKKFSVRAKDSGSDMTDSKGHNHRHIQFHVTGEDGKTGSYDHIHDLLEDHFGKKLGGAIIDSAHDNDPLLSKLLSKDYQDTKAHLQYNPDAAATGGRNQHVKDPKTSYFKLGGHDGIKRTKAEIEALQKHAVKNGARYTGHGDVWGISQNHPSHDALITTHGGAMKRAYVRKETDAGAIKPQPNAVGKLEGKLKEMDEDSLSRQGMFDEESALSRASIPNKTQQKQYQKFLKDQQPKTPKNDAPKPNKMVEASKNKKDSRQLAEARQGMFDEEGDLAREWSKSQNERNQDKAVDDLNKVFGYQPPVKQPKPKPDRRAIEKLKEATAKAQDTLKETGAKTKVKKDAPKDLKTATAQAQQSLIDVAPKTNAPPPPTPSKPVEVKNVVQTPKPSASEGGYTGKEFKGKTYIDSTHDTVNMGEAQKRRLGVQHEIVDGKKKHFVDFSHLEGKNHERAVSDLNKHKQPPVKVTQGLPRK